MTIVLLCNHFPPLVDGVGDYTYRLANALSGLGLTVHVICRKQNPVSFARNFTVHPVIQNWGLPGRRTVLNIIRAIKPDWVGLQYVPYAFQRRGLPFFLPGFLKQIHQTGARVWVMFHEVHIRFWGPKSTLIGVLQRRIARRLCQAADSISTSIDFYRGLLLSFCPDVRVIPIGTNVDTEPMPGHERLALRNRLFPGKTFIISTFGLRNQSELIRAAENVSTGGLSIGLLICGASAFFNQQKSHPLVHATGYLPASEIGRYLQCSDLFVLPDYVSPRGEGGTCLKSGSLAAGFAAGLPVVGVRGDMTGAPLEHGVNIWLAENGGAEQLAQAITTVGERLDLRTTLQAGGQTLYHQHLSWNAIGKACLEFLQTQPNVASHP